MWNKLSIREKGQYIRDNINKDYKNLEDIVSSYNTFDEGGEVKPYDPLFIDKNKDKLEFMVKSLGDKGYDDAQISAIIGNVTTESTLNPLIEDDMGSKGLLQWRDVRRTDMEAYQNKSTVNPNIDKEFQRQVDYIGNNIKEGSTIKEWNKGTNSTYDKAIQAKKEFFTPLQIPYSNEYNLSRKEYSLRKGYVRPKDEYAHEDRRIQDATYIFNNINNYKDKKPVIPESLTKKSLF